MGLCLHHRWQGPNPGPQAARQAPFPTAARLTLPLLVGEGSAEDRCPGGDRSRAVYQWHHSFRTCLKALKMSGVTVISARRRTTHCSKQKTSILFSSDSYQPQRKGPPGNSSTTVQPKESVPPGQSHPHPQSKTVRIFQPPFKIRSRCLQARPSKQDQLRGGWLLVGRRNKTFAAEYHSRADPGNRGSR